MRANNSMPRARVSPTIKRPATCIRPKHLVFSSDPPRAESATEIKRASSASAYEESPDMRALREQLYERQDFTDIQTESLDTLYCSLREYALQKGGQRNYSEAQKAWALSEDVRAELHVRHPLQDPNHIVEAGCDSRPFEEHWKRNFDEFDADSAARIAALQAQQEEQVKKFEKFWENDMPPRYRKPSTHLLQLRRMEKCLAVCTEFERAKAIHEEAEALSAQERAQQQAALIRDYEGAKRRLIARQAAERDLLVETRAHERAIRAEQCERDRDAINNRVFVIDIRKKEAEKGYRTQNRPRTAVGRGGTFSLAYDKAGIDDVLLAPLLPPNDPGMRDAGRKRKREEERKKSEYQQQNAEATLRKYKLMSEAQRAQEAQRRQEAASTELRESKSRGLGHCISDAAVVLLTMVEGGEMAEEPSQSGEGGVEGDALDSEEAPAVDGPTDDQEPPGDDQPSTEDQTGGDEQPPADDQPPVLEPAPSEDATVTPGDVSPATLPMLIATADDPPFL